MVRPGLRGSGKVKRRTPGGRAAVFYVERFGSPTCGRCGVVLLGTAKGSVSEVRAMRHSERIPSRMYAGVLCSDCVDRMVRYVTRMESKFASPGLQDLDVERDLTIEKFLPSGWWGSVQKGKLIWNKQKKGFKRKAKSAKEEKPSVSERAPKAVQVEKPKAKPMKEKPEKAKPAREKAAARKIPAKAKGKKR